MESAQHYKELSPTCIIRKEEGEMAPGRMQFHIPHVFCTAQPSMCALSGLGWEPRPHQAPSEQCLGTSLCPDAQGAWTQVMLGFFQSQMPN